MKLLVQGHIFYYFGEVNKMKNINDREMIQIVTLFMLICIAFAVIFTYGAIKVKFDNNSYEIDYNSISLVQNESKDSHYIYNKDFRYSITSDECLRIDKKYTLYSMTYNPILKIFEPQQFTYYKKFKLIKITSMDQN